MKKRIVLLVCIVLLAAGTLIVSYNLSKCRATMTDKGLSFDGYTYHWVNYEEIGEYTETYHLICRTEFWGGYSVYEIKEFPDHEYVVVRSYWDAEVYKRD